MSDLRQIIKVIGQWPILEIPGTPNSDSSIERLRLALLDLRENSAKVGVLDIVGLLRNCLRQHFPDTFVIVPTEKGWPSREVWEACGFEVLPGGDRLRVRARNYTPTWLCNTPNLSVSAAVEQRTPRRKKYREVADPGIIEACGYEYYQSPGQREAVRAAFFMLPGDTLVINLPTGSGKTLAAFAPSFISDIGTGGGLTIFTTPTIALGLDLEQRMQQDLYHKKGLAPIRLAYHSGLDDSEKLEIKKRIRDGQQPILFASPESLLGALKVSILSAAEAGYLRYFVIDEAHLVASWGSSFRPEFQTLSGLRRWIIRKAPEGLKPKTLLMTGTLTQSALEVLRVLFGNSGRVGIVSAAQQRCEPELWVHNALDEEQQREYIMDLVRHSPRPFILYTTQPTKAKEWFNLIQEEGLIRCGCITGLTPPGQREDFIKSWRDMRLDAMVATAAFGLGVDQADVRTVIHACVPESFDRFYQEIGRGGRDGNASSSIVVYTSDDLELANGMAIDPLITTGRGFERWQAMWQNARLHSDEKDHEFRCVNLNEKPVGVDQDSDANIAWNMRTLVLMAKAGLLQFDAVLPPSQMDEGDGDDEFGRWSEYFQSVAVRVESGHNNYLFWEESVEKYRMRQRALENESIMIMVSLLTGEIRMVDAISRAYDLEEIGKPDTIQGTCPVDRRRGITIHVPDFPEPTVLVETNNGIDERLYNATGYIKGLALVIRPNASPSRAKYKKQDLLRFLQRCVDLGIREVVANADWLGEPGFRELYRRAPERFIAFNQLENVDRQTSMHGLVPRVSIVEDRTPMNVVRNLLSRTEPLHIIIASDNKRDPDHPARPISVRPHIKFSLILSRVSA